jgi:hypothetical protein
MGALQAMGLALLLTAGVEAAVGWLLGLRQWRSQGVLLCINLLTNPLLNLLTAALAYSGAYRIASPFDPLLIALEAGVIAAEAMLLKAALGISTDRAALLSILANTASWLAGAWLFW